MISQTWIIGKAIRALFADRVTYRLFVDTVDFSVLATFHLHGIFLYDTFSTIVLSMLVQTKR